MPCRVGAVASKTFTANRTVEKPWFVFILSYDTSGVNSTFVSPLPGAEDPAAVRALVANILYKDAL